MSERQPTDKTLEQDVFGIFFAGVGGYFAVSIVLALLGHEPGGGLLTAPVEELIRWLGPWAGLLLSAGLAVLGTLQFLSPRILPTQRWLGATVAAALGLAFLCGSFAAGGELGRVFPDLVTGLGGRVLGAVLGLALLWMGLVLGSGALRPGAEVRRSPRIDLSPRAEVAGVSAAEAALLVTEPAARPMPLLQRAAPIRTEIAPPRHAVPDRARETVAAAPSAAESRVLPITKKEGAKREIAKIEIAKKEEVRPIAASTTRPLVEPPRASIAPVAPPAPLTESEAPPSPSWEQDEEPELEDELETAAELDEVEEEELEEDGPDLAPSVEDPATQPAAWEQVGLFDEEEEEDEEEADAEAEPLASNGVPPLPEPTRVADEDAFVALEDEPSEDPFALEPAPPPLPEPRSAPAPAKPEVEFVIQPRPVPAPAAARDDASERWKKLVYECGCLVLEQNRVAVSMLERRFGIDFDQACKALDELQQAGLIGPYMGGRTRDILLSRDEWLAHAPPAS